MLKKATALAATAGILASLAISIPAEARPGWRGGYRGGYAVRPGYRAYGYRRGYGYGYGGAAAAAALGAAALGAAAAGGAYYGGGDCWRWWYGRWVWAC
jgi:hypothetical protein